MNNNLILKNIQVQFFKSIGNTTIEIPDLAVFVGKNAAGKSNIVSVFRFLRDLADKGFQTAVQKQGGRENLFNMLELPSDQIKSNDKVIIKVRFEMVNPRIFVEYDGFTGRYFRIVHSIILGKETGEFSTTETFVIDTVLEQKQREIPTINDWDGEQIIITKDVIGYPYYSTSPASRISFFPNAQIDNNRHKNNRHKNLDVKIQKKSLIELERYWGKDIKGFYSSIGFFDFIPKLIKSSVNSIGNATLDEDGGNINIILQNILLDEEKRRTFINLVQYVLPYINDIEIDVPRHGFAIPIIRENYSDKYRLPAEFFSDGTATVIAIIVALFFEENSIVVIEEPERYVHPAIMDKLATLFEDASRNKKVVVTTHSPDLIRHLKPEHVQLVSRDKDHFTQIRRVTEDEEIKSFLAGEMQLDDLLVNNFFED